MWGWALSYVVELELHMRRSMSLPSWIEQSNEEKNDKQVNKIFTY